MDTISLQSFFIALVSLFLLANLKCLPFIWHLRLFTFLPRLLTYRRPPPGTLFQPLVMHTRTPLLELDFMLHKNNATFATDVDIARSHLIGALFLPVLWKPPMSLIDPARQGYAKGMLGIILGGVGMWYKREIKPYNPYTIHTSLLTYDHKWIYFISHFIRPDFRLSRRGSSTLLHESRDEAVNAIKVKARGKAGRQEATATREMAEKAVLATVISKNIFRLGREKVVPERVLRAVNLLPSSSSSSSKSVGSRLGGLSMEEVEERRKRGMKVVESNDGDVAHAWFGEMWAEGAEKEGEEGWRVLAEYRDWFAFG